MNRYKLLILYVFLLMQLLACQFYPMQQQVGPEAQTALIESSVSKLEAAPLQSKHFEELSFDNPLVVGRKLIYQHESYLPTMEIDGFRSFVKAFRIERYSSIHSLVVKSYLWHPRRLGRPSVSSVLFPSILLLDDGFQVVADFKRADFRYSSVSAFDDGIITSLTLPGRAQRASYLLVYVASVNRIGTLKYCRKGAGMISFQSTHLPVYKEAPCHAVPFNVEGRVELLLK